MPIAPHPLAPDGDGGCAQCPLLPANRVHDVPAAQASYTPAAVSLDAPVTSAMAAAAAEPRRGHLRAAILHLLTTRGPMTDHELEAALARPHQTVSSARNALMLDHLVAQATDGTGQPVTRPTASGRPAIVWAPTTAGRVAARTAAA